MKKPTFEQAKRAYINRYTMEHVPQWARKICTNGFFYAPQYRTDLEWYENSTFKGEPDWFGTGSDCQSHNQSWPLGQWLDEPFYTRRGVIA